MRHIILNSTKYLCVWHVCLSIAEAVCVVSSTGSEPVWDVQEHHKAFHRNGMKCTQNRICTSLYPPYCTVSPAPSSCLLCFPFPPLRDLYLAVPLSINTEIQLFFFSFTAILQTSPEATKNRNNNNEKKKKKRKKCSQLGLESNLKECRGLGGSGCRTS